MADTAATLVNPGDKYLSDIPEFTPSGNPAILDDTFDDETAISIPTGGEKRVKWRFIIDRIINN